MREVLSLAQHRAPPPRVRQSAHQQVRLAASSPPRRRVGQLKPVPLGFFARRMLDDRHIPPTRRLARLAVRPQAVLPLCRVEALLAHSNLGLRDKTLWRLLYETAARAGEALALDIGDLDLRNRRAKVRRKGGAADVIVWQTGTARLLPRLMAGRRAGPVFLTSRAARVPLAPTDLDNGPFTLHQPRHSALTHAAETGANTSTLLAYSGRTSIASLARYTHVSPNALARWHNDRDPARRR